MKTKLLLRIILIVVSLSTPFMCNAQRENRETLAKFIINHGEQNKVDITEWVVNSGLFTVFYTINDVPYMANVSDNGDSQSWGRIWGFESYSKEETDTEYQADVFYFNWSYANTYDNKRGTCKIEFIKIYKPQGVVSILKMITESLDVIEYTGYMEGSIDFSDF